MKRIVLSIFFCFQRLLARRTTPSWKFGFIHRAWSLLFVGHTWIQLVDDNEEVVSYEITGKGMKKNQAEAHDVSIYYSWPLGTPEVQKVIDLMEKRIKKNAPYNLISNNCVHVVREGMAAAGIPHPDFVMVSGLPSPICLYEYIKLLNKGYSPGFIAKKYRNHHNSFTPVGTKKSLQRIRDVE